MKKKESQKSRTAFFHENIAQFFAHCIAKQRYTMRATMI